jgi:hypothetical protein
MSAEPPPSGGNAGFNPDDWTNANDPIDNQFLAANYLQFPLAQGAQTLANTTVSGVLTVQNDSTFADLATFNNGIEIATTAGITFSDTTVQTTAFIEANYAQLNTDNIFLPTFTNTFNGSVDLGSSAIATTQPSGTNSTLVATTAFVQDAVQVSGVQTTDSPLLWQGANTWQYNAGTGATLGYSYPYGISNLWNLTGGQGDCNIVANGGGNGGWDNAFRIYCVQNNITGSGITALTPQLQLSNNGTSMQVKDGINIPLGQNYSINNVNILSPYSTTVQMNSAISTATSPLAPINSPTFTGLPLLTTTPTAGITNALAIANLQYITNQGFAPLASPAFTGNPTYGGNTLATVNQIPSVAGYAPLNSPALTGIPTSPTWTTGNNTQQIANVAYIQGLISTLAQTYPPNALTALTGGLATNWIIIAPIPTFLTGTIQGTTVYLNDCTFTARINYQGQGNVSIAFWNLGRNLATNVSAFNMTGSIVNLTILDTYPMYLTYYTGTPANIEMQNSDIPISFWNTGGNYQITFSGAFTFT